MFTWEPNEFSRKVMTSIVRLEGTATKGRIREDLLKDTGKDYALGKISFMLDRLEYRGYIFSDTITFRTQTRVVYKLSAKGHIHLEQAPPVEKKKPWHLRLLGLMSW